jgi:hypothetical protein
MKKLILLSCIPLLMAACKSSGNKTAADSSQNEAALRVTSIKKTLNGIDQAQAKKMIDYFEKSMQDFSTTEQASYFLNKDMLQKMVGLLESEKKKNPDVDGLRIYFGKESLKDPRISLLLVSTKAFKDPANPDKTHDDYYEHPDTARLFQSSTNLKIIRFASTAMGTSLNVHCDTCPDLDPSCTGPQDIHYITRKTAEEMIKGFGGHKLNTRAEWFDLEMLRAMVRDPKCAGIRVYLATRTAQQDDPDRDAVVLTTTFINDNGVLEDYFECSTLKDYFDQYKRLKKRILPDPGRDNGELCPTNCN